MYTYEAVIHETALNHCYHNEFYHILFGDTFKGYTFTMLLTIDRPICLNFDYTRLNGVNFNEAKLKGET